MSRAKKNYSLRRKKTLKKNNAQDVQDVQEVSMVPEVSNVPNVPEVSEVSNVPNVPNVPEVQNVPNVPQVPNTPKVPEVPEVSEITNRSFINLKAIRNFNNFNAAVSSALNTISGVVNKIADLANAAGDLQQKLSFDMLNVIDIDVENPQERIEEIQNKIRDFSIRAKINMADAAATVKKFLSNGFSEDIALNLLPDMNRFRRVFGASLTEMSQLYVNMGKIGVNLNSKVDLSNNINSVFAAASAANMSVADYNTMLKKSTSTLSNFGLNLENINTKIMFLAQEGYSGGQITRIIEQFTEQLSDAQKAGKSLEDGVENIFNGEALVVMRKFQERGAESMDGIMSKIAEMQKNNRIEILARVHDTQLNATLERLSSIGDTIKNLILLAAIPVLSYVLGFLENIYNFTLNLITPFGEVFNFIAYGFQQIEGLALAFGAVIAAAFGPAVFAVGAIIGGFYLINSLVERFNEILEGGGEQAAMLEAIFTSVLSIVGIIAGIVAGIVAKQKISLACEIAKNSIQKINSALDGKNLVSIGAMIKKQAILTGLKIKAAFIVNPIAAGIALGAGVVAAGGLLAGAYALSQPSIPNDIDAAFEQKHENQEQNLLERFAIPTLQTFDPTVQTNAVQNTAQHNMSVSERTVSGSGGSSRGGSGKERVVRHEIRMFLDRGMSAVSSTGQRSVNGVLDMSFRD